MPSLLLLIIILAVLLAVLPVWPYSRAWGYYPGGFIGLLLLLLLVLLAMGRL
jgi:hypothetical protein